MSRSTIERIGELRRRRLGRYHDLVIEAGVCDASGNGRELTHDDLRDLDETALLLGKTERALTDDLVASQRFHQLSRQLAAAEDQKPGTEKTIAKLSGQIKQAVADRNAANDARNTARRSGKPEAAMDRDREYACATGEISRLENEVSQARRPLAACELLPKQISELAALNPWLRVCVDGR